jgi:hypothetical protein
MDGLVIHGDSARTRIARFDSLPSCIRWTGPMNDDRADIAGPIGKRDACAWQYLPDRRSRTLEHRRRPLRRPHRFRDGRRHPGGVLPSRLSIGIAQRRELSGRQTQQRCGKQRNGHQHLQQRSSRAPPRTRADDTDRHRALRRPEISNTTFRAQPELRAGIAPHGHCRPLVQVLAGRSQPPRSSLGRPPAAMRMHRRDRSISAPAGSATGASSK